jgi:methyl-accepting chemotaxis protein
MGRLNSLFRKREPDPRSPDNSKFAMSFIAQMIVPIFVLDRSGTVIIWNKACEELTGLSASNVIGTKNHWKGLYAAARPCLADLVLNGGGANATALYASHNKEVASNGWMKANNWCDLPRGVRRYLAFDAGPIRDDQGQLVAVLETIQDLTAMKEMEEERRRAEEEAIQRDHEVVAAIGAGLSKLAAKELSFRLSAEMPEAYRQLQIDFNAAIEQLEDAMQSVTDSMHAIHSGTLEISAASDDLSRRTEQQAASLEETAAALDQITATVKKSAEGASHARQVVMAADEDAKKSAGVVHQSFEAMDGIAKSARQISQIISVIDEIAFQTNLLALNAGVEAARAGDAGRGFAVVASEVRALAQRSAEAAKEIKSLISASTTQVDHGVKLVSETGKSLERIITQVTEINQVVAEIATGAEEQAKGLTEINSAINQMDQVTQQNAAMVEQSTAASHSLTQETERMASLIGQFQIGAGRDNQIMRRELEKVAPHAFRQPTKVSGGRGSRSRT